MIIDTPFVTWGFPTTGIRDYDKARALKEFQNLKDLWKGSGLEEHGMMLELDLFEKMVLPDYTKPHSVYLPE